MKVALIAPKNLLDFTRLGDMHFITPVNASPVFFRQEKLYKMLDNGTYELGQPMNFDELLELAHRMKVDEVVLPDVMKNRGATMRLTLDSVGFKPKRMKFAAVPQGHNLASFVECYRDFAKVDNIDVLCFPIWLEKDFHARPQVIHYLWKKKYWAPKEHHLIGLDRLSELFCYTYGLIRSVDTSLPFSAAAQGLTLSYLGEYTGPRINLVRADAHPEYIRFNIRKLREASRYA